MSERTHKKSNWLSTPQNQDSALKLRRFTTKDDKDEEIQQSPDINLSEFSVSTNPPFPDSNIQRQEEGEKEDKPELDETIQTKLTVGQPGDKYEQEADTVAAKVVEQINSPQTNQPIQGKIEPVVKPTVMRQGGAAGGAVNQDVEQNIQQARGSGQGLAENVRQPMEQAFDADFSGVKVHTDGQADVLNRSLNSRAFATGQDIFFKQGEYQPQSKQGQELLAHELTHVVQQANNNQVQQKKTVKGSTTNPRKKAINLLLSTNISSGPWKKLSWNIVRAGALQTLKQPNSVNQGNLSLCGPAVIVNELAYSDPIRYAQLVRKIFLTAEINGKRVNDDLLKNQHPKGINPADWIVMSAMRDEENSMVDYEGTPEEDFSGITTPSEIAQWMESVVGCVNTETYTSYLWGEITNAKKINSLLSSYGSKKVTVAMLVDANKLQNNDTAFNIPNHWIRLLSPINIDRNTVTFEAFTWGRKEKFSFNKNASKGIDFEDVIFEFVVGAKEKGVTL